MALSPIHQGKRAVTKCVIWRTTVGFMFIVFRNKYCYLLYNRFVYRKCQLKSRPNVVMFHCRRWAVSHWRCWRRCWWGRSYCFIQVTVMVMTIVFHTSPASQWVLSDIHSLCCPQCVRVGGKHSLAGRIHRLLTGSVVNSGRRLNVSVQCKPKPSVTKPTWCFSCFNTDHEYVSVCCLYCLSLCLSLCRSGE